MGLAAGAQSQAAQFTGGTVDGANIQRVLMISIDGMHAVDFYNCVHGIAGANGGAPYCPTLAALEKHSFTFSEALTPRPSDSFPGLVALITGGSPKTTGAFYDVSYDRALSPPAQTTPYGIPGGHNLCPKVIGTQVGFDEEIDYNYTMLYAGGGINPNYLPRDPNANCEPVWPHNFIKVNTIFEVVKQAGGYTAWSDKHPAYELVNGRSGRGVDELFTPEINSIPVALPTVKRLACSPLPDQTAVSSSNAWTDSFANVRCYDELKVEAILHEIEGKSPDGSMQTAVPNLFGMNFQAVSVGEKLVEASINTTGGYMDAQGTPSTALLGQLQYVDSAIGAMVQKLKTTGLYDTTAIIITAKHGQSPIDTSHLMRIPHDMAGTNPPSNYVSTTQADEDDISMLWLTDRSASGLASAVATLEANKTQIGANAGEIFYGPSLSLMFNTNDSRTPDIVVAPNVGVVYTGGGKKVAEHGGWANDDRNVMLMVANPAFKATEYSQPVQINQVAPTILDLLGLDPTKLDSVSAEGVETLPGL